MKNKCLLTLKLCRNRTFIVNFRIRFPFSPRAAMLVWVLRTKVALFRHNIVSGEGGSTERIVITHSFNNFINDCSFVNVYDQYFDGIFMLFMLLFADNDEFYIKFAMAVCVLFTSINAFKEVIQVTELLRCTYNQIINILSTLPPCSPRVCPRVAVHGVSRSKILYKSLHQSQEV